MKEELLNNLSSILSGSKQYKFDYGDYGMSVLILTGYYSGKQVSLDLGKLLQDYPEVVEDILVTDEEED